MPYDHISTYSSMDAYLQMQLQVDTEYDLNDEHEHQERRKRRVDVMGELPTTMGMPKEVAGYREKDAEDLERYVPSRTNDLSSGQSCRHPTSA